MAGNGYPVGPTSSSSTTVVANAGANYNASEGSFGPDYISFLGGDGSNQKGVGAARVFAGLTPLASVLMGGSSLGDNASAIIYSARNDGTNNMGNANVFNQAPASQVASVNWSMLAILGFAGLILYLMFKN